MSKSSVEERQKYWKEIGRQYARKYRASLDDPDSLCFRLSQRGLYVTLKDRILQDVAHMRCETLGRMLEAAPASTFNLYPNILGLNGRMVL